MTIKSKSKAKKLAKAYSYNKEYTDIPVYVIYCYGIFYSHEMFDEDLRFMNEDQEGRANLPHYQRPITIETYYSLLFGPKNCFGDIGTACIKISCISEKDIETIKALQKFSTTPEFNKYIHFRKSKNLERLLRQDL